MLPCLAFAGARGVLGARKARSGGEEWKDTKGVYSVDLT